MHVENVVPLKVAEPSHIPIHHRDPTEFIAQHPDDFTRLPDEEFALFTLRVSIGRRVKSTSLTVSHLAIQIVQRLLHNLREVRITASLPRMKI